MLKSSLRTVQLVQQLVFPAVHGGWTDDGRVREHTPYCVLAGTLGAVECRGRVVRSVQVRNLNKALYTSTGGDASNSFCRADVDVLVGEVPASVRVSRHNSNNM